MESSVTTVIIELVSHELELSRRLLGLLTDERELLITRQHQALIELVDAKTHVLEAIDQNAEQRYNLLSSRGAEPNEAAWRLLVESLSSEQLKNVWEELLDVLADCKHSNEVNGRMIARSRVTMGRLLNLLRGQFDAPELYNSAGATEGLGESRTSIRA